MTRKHAIVDAEPHLIISHGSDFFGQDRHSLKSLASLAPYASSAFSWNDQKVVAALVQALENPTARTIPASEAAVFAEQLLKVARGRHIKPAVSALARALADAAGRAADAGEPWEWQSES